MQPFFGRAIVFDLDGVLADSTYAVNASWEAWAKRHDLDPAVAIANGHGRPSIDAIRLTAPHLNAEEPYERVARALGVEPWHCVVFEDAPSGIIGDS